MGEDEGPAAAAHPARQCCIYYAIIKWQLCMGIGICGGDQCVCASVSMDPSSPTDSDLRRRLAIRRLEMRAKASRAISR